jgi:hypothetical protein
MLLVYAVVIGLIAGVASGGRLAPLGSVHIRLWGVALLGLVFQAFLFSSPLAAVVGQFGPPLYVGSTALVLIALLVNLRQPGFVLIAAGAVLNFTVVLANGGQMPASPEAVAALMGAPVLPTTGFTNSVIAGPETNFAFLGDIFVLPRPLPLANFFSIGDVLIGVGGAWFIARTMHRRQDAPQIRAARRVPAQVRPSHG